MSSGAALLRPVQAEVDQQELSELVRALRTPGFPTTGHVRLGSYTLEYVAPRAFASTLELLFLQRIYDVDFLRPPARIVDAGAWVGLSVLRFRMRFPDVPVIAFEPDPTLFAMMCRNLERNGVDDVETIQAAVAAEPGDRDFITTGSDSGSLVAAARGSRTVVPTVPLSRFADSPTSLLKLNIEGAEAEVIAELGAGLTMVDQTLIEYHGFAELPQTLHMILAALDRAGHTYIVSHFNEKNHSCVPPLRLGPSYRYFLLINSRRLDGTARGDGAVDLA